MKKLILVIVIILIFSKIKTQKTVEDDSKCTENEYPVISYINGYTGQMLFDCMKIIEIKEINNEVIDELNKKFGDYKINLIFRDIFKKSNIAINTHKDGPKLIILTLKYLQKNDIKIKYFFESAKEIIEKLEEFPYFFEELHKQNNNTKTVIEHMKKFIKVNKEL